MSTDERGWKGLFLNRRVQKIRHRESQEIRRAVQPGTLRLTYETVANSVFFSFLRGTPSAADPRVSCIIHRLVLDGNSRTRDHGGSRTRWWLRRVEKSIYDAMRLALSESGPIASPVPAVLPCTLIARTETCVFHTPHVRRTSKIQPNPTQPQPPGRSAAPVVCGLSIAYKYVFGVHRFHSHTYLTLPLPNLTLTSTLT